VAAELGHVKAIGALAKAGAALEAREEQVSEARVRVRARARVRA
jgi:hypothetical protein